jgi:hypothetical protein
MADRALPDGVRTQYALDYILTNLGIEDVSKLECKKVVDIGCGKDARLVRFLRNKGVLADGIDPLAKGNEDYLFRTTGSKTGKESDYYDLAVCHMAHFKDGMLVNMHLIKCMVGEDAARQIYQNKKQEMYATTNEAIRILKPETRLIIWPIPTYFIEDIRPQLDARRISAVSERTGGELALDPNDPMHALFGERGMRLVREEYSHRLVITKP